MQTKLIHLTYILWIALCLTLFYSCAKQAPIDVGEMTSFFPPMTQLQSGMVSKYYVHSIPKNKDKSSSADISYMKYQFQKPNLLTVTTTDAAFKLKWEITYLLENDQMRMQDYFEIYKRDTAKTTITDNVSFDWKNDEARAYRILRLKDMDVLIENKQTAVKDTMVDGLPAKLFNRVSHNIAITETDTTNYNRTESIVYLQGVGFYSREMILDDMTMRLELIEQMSTTEYGQRKSKAKKRIAYIDPASTIDDNKEFTICNEEDRIGDYYNGTARGELKGGKGSWWRILKKELNEELLHNESGYLTYRFVINCKGEAGRFITEQTGLDFKKKLFHEETVNHLYDIVSTQKDWQACYLRKEYRDSYTYITFKLQNGKIIDLLP